MSVNINKMVGEYQDGFSLEQDFYISPDVFKQDMEKLISQRWLLVDHVSRIPAKGDYFLFEIGNESIIIIRKSEDEIRAFYNVCRHRGSLICLEQQGKKKLLTCPYHAWSYNLDGELLPPRLMASDFDPSLFGLHSCHIKICHGLIFVCTSSDAPPDFDEEYSGFMDSLAFHGFNQAKIAVKRDYPNGCNWKLVVENFLECYHCAPSHPEYCAVHPEDQLLALGAGPGSGPQEAVDKYQPQLDAFYELAEKLGHPLPDIDRTEDSFDMAQLARLPINDRNFASETRDGSPGSTILMGNFKETDYGETAIVFNPVSYILASNYVAMMARFTPRDAINTDVQLTWLVHEDAVEGEHYNADEIAWVWDTTIKQDKTITENNNAGVLSSRYQPGPYSTQEERVATFVKWYVNSIS
jgi:Rieske 2Fe-2S family protein